MSIENWWPKLATEANEDWLIQHNGEAIPAADMVKKITSVGGRSATRRTSGATRGRTCSDFSDETGDWIEAVANGETPSGQA